MDDLTTKSPTMNYQPSQYHPYYYKFLKGLVGPHSCYPWTWGHWLPAVSGPLLPRRNGYHVLTPDGLIDWLASDLYRVEVRRDWVWKHEGKVLVVRQARLHSKVEQWNERSQRLIAAEFAQWALDQFWTNKSDTRPQQAIDAARKRAKGEPVAWALSAIAAKDAAESPRSEEWPAAAAATAELAARTAEWPAITAVQLAARMATAELRWADVARKKLNTILINCLRTGG